MSVIYHPHWPQAQPWPGLARPPLRPEPPPLAWLALALAMALAGLALAQLFIGAGLLTVTAGYALATLPATGGLGIALGFLGIEVLLCGN